MKLEHIMPYSSYSVTGKFAGPSETQIWTLDVLISDVDYTKHRLPIYQFLGYDACQLLLRPLSDLNEEIEYSGEKFWPLPRINSAFPSKIVIDDELDFQVEIEDGATIEYIEFKMFEQFREYLLEWHFDVFGLIEKGLAIDINTLKP